MLVRIRPEVQAVLRDGPVVTEPTGFDTGDDTVDAALTDLAATDPVAANQAEAAFGALTWGQGLQIVSLRGVQEFLWYQLPSKFAVTLDEHRRTRARPRGPCSTWSGSPATPNCAAARSPTPSWSPTTPTTAAGIAAYRKALAAGGVEPPDIPGLLTWGGMLGVEEHAAFWSLADHLEVAITAGVYTPGGRGWRATATEVARGYLTVSRLELGGDSYLDRIHTERRDRWAESRGPGRAALTQAVLPLLTDPPAVPVDAEDHLAQIRWFLAAFDGDGAPLTVNHTLGRALLTEACHRFDWLILGKQAPPENQLPEAHRLRSILTQLGATRRRGRRLLLTTRGQQLLKADTPTLWDAVTGTLIPTEPAQAGAAEILLMLLVTDQAPAYGSPVIADILTGEGWRTEDGGPLTADGTGWLTGDVTRPPRVPAPDRKTQPDHPVRAHPHRPHRGDHRPATARPPAPPPALIVNSAAPDGIVVAPGAGPRGTASFALPRSTGQVT